MRLSSPAGPPLTLPALGGAEDAGEQQTGRGGGDGFLQSSASASSTGSSVDDEGFLDDDAYEEVEEEDEQGGEGEDENEDGDSQGARGTETGVRAGGRAPGGAERPSQQYDEEAARYTDSYDRLNRLMSGRWPTSRAVTRASAEDEIGFEVVAEGAVRVIRVCRKKDAMTRGGGDERGGEGKTGQPGESAGVEVKVEVRQVDLHLREVSPALASC